VRIMGKGIIMETRGNKAVVLTPEGEFRKVPVSGKEYQIGQEIEFRFNRTASFYKWGAIAAVLALVILIPFIFNFIQIGDRAYAYVQMDINPSVEFTINKYSKIIDTRGLNSEGQEMLEGSKLKGKDLEYGIQYFTVKSYEMGYVNAENESHILITTVMESENNKSIEKEIEKKAANAVRETVQGKSITAKVSVLKASKEIKEEAEKNGLSSGKFLLLLQAKKDGMDIDEEDVRELSITAVLKKAGGDIDKIIKEARKTEEEMEQLLKMNGEKEKIKKEMNGLLKKHKEEIEAIKDKYENKGQNKENTPDRSKEIKEDIKRLKEKKKEKIKEEMEGKREDRKEDISERIKERIGDIPPEKDESGISPKRDDDFVDEEEQDEDDDLDDEERSDRDDHHEGGNRSGVGFFIHAED